MNKKWLLDFPDVFIHCVQPSPAGSHDIYTMCVTWTKPNNKQSDKEDKYSVVP